jgi:hypothetical protein
VLGAARPNLNNDEAQEVEELVTEYEDIFVTNDSDYGRTNRVYYRMDIEDA